MVVAKRLQIIINGTTHNMSTEATILNKYLRAIYDIDDKIYKSLISDISGVPAGVITNPNDYNIGAIANILEYTRRLSIDLLDQLFLNRAEGKYLDLIAQEVIGIVRYAGESDTDYVDRIQKFIISPKVSPAALIFCLRPFSTAEPVFLEGEQDAAFANVSYASQYNSFQQLTIGPENLHWILPAIASGTGDGSFFFSIVLENVADEDIVKIIDIIERIGVAGVNFSLQLVQ